jgi:copper chaperone CopZ
MTCAHAVSGALKELEGMSDVAVDLHPCGESAVTATSEAPLAAGAVTAALDEAGDYHLGGLPRGSRRPAFARGARIRSEGQISYPERKRAAPIT